MSIHPNELRDPTDNNGLRWVACATMVAGLLSALALMVAGAAPSTPATPKVDFNRDIRPILSANCFACHGQDPDARQAKLRLDLRPDAVARITAANPTLLMPPASTGHTLTAAQKKLLTDWIRQGAPYDTHWSFK